jgi:tRNA-dihydrouridine synthase A
MNLSIAPMLKWTDRHYRFFMRQINKQVVLYSEMIVANAVIHNHKKLLKYDQLEHPLVLQLGGSDPKLLKEATKIAIDYGYPEINLNVGCPSDRVQSGKFGACLMKEPVLVAECISAMMTSSKNNQISVKHRIGVDHDYSYPILQDFVRTVANVGCKKFIVHARNAILQGLNPKENRTIPPLKYEIVYQLKKDFADLEIIINGGITSLQDASIHHQHVDGVMIGRSAYHNPFLFAKENITRKQVAENMIEYLTVLFNNNEKLHSVLKHMLGLYYNTYIAKIWKRNLTIISTSNNLQAYKDLVKNLPENL